MASEPRRSDMRGGVVALVVLALLLAGVLFVMRPLDAIPRVSAASFLGPDGHLEVTEADGTRIIRQTAHNTGGEMLGSGPSGLALADDMINKLDARFVRLLVTRVDEGQAATSTHAFELTGRGVLRTATLDATTTVFQPAPVELPADVAEGSTWSDEGEMMRVTALGLPTWRGFTRESSVTAPEDPDRRDEGCLLVTHTLTTDQGSVDTDDLWCPGRGVVEGTPSQLPGADPGINLADDFQWSPQEWEATPLDLLSDPPLFWGTNIPSAGTDDVLVIAHSTSGDVIFAPGHEVRAAVRAHPGGHVTTLTRFGQLVVATSTQARVAAYDLQGMPVWEGSTPDVVTSRPVLLGDLLVLVDSAGTVTAVDPVSGEHAWDRALRVQATGAMAACHDVVVVPTNSEELIALDSQGHEQWMTKFPEDVSFVACGPQGFVVHTGDRLELLSDQGARTHSVVINDSALRHLFVADDVVTVSSTAVTRYRSSDLAVLARRGEALVSVVQAGRHLVGVSPERLMVWDSAGQEVGEWPTTIAPAHMNAYLTPLGRGVLLLGPDLSALVVR